MTFTIRINGTPRTVDVAGDTPINTTEKLVQLSEDAKKLTELQHA